GNRVRTTSRARGPTTATSAQWSVTDVRWTRSSGHSVCSHSSIQSRTAAAPPVVVVASQRSSPRCMTTPSSKTMPSALHIRRNRHVGRAKRGDAHRADRLAELGGNDGALVDARRLPLVTPGSNGGEPLDMLNRAHPGPHGPSHIGDGDVPLQVYEVG